MLNFATKIIMALRYLGLLDKIRVVLLLNEQARSGHRLFPLVLHRTVQGGQGHQRFRIGRDSGPLWCARLSGRPLRSASYTEPTVVAGRHR